MDPAATPALIPGIARIAGPLLLALFLNVGIYGALSAQFYLYYISFPNEKPGLKRLVYVVFTLETLQTTMILKSLFDAFVFGFTSIASLNQIGNLWFSVPLLGGIVAFISQSFYAYRIIILGQSFKGAKYAATVISLLALAQLGGAIAVAIEMIRAKQFSRLTILPIVKISVGAFWNGSGALGDITIAIWMTYILYRNSRTTMKHAREVVERVVRLTIETGTLTAVIAITNTILTLLPGDPTYYQATATVLSKMYANSILVVLNSRLRFVPGSQLSSRFLRSKGATTGLSQPNETVIFMERVERYD